MSSSPQPRANLAVHLEEDHPHATANHGSVNKGCMNSTNFITIRIGHSMVNLFRYHWQSMLWQFICRIFSCLLQTCCSRAFSEPVQCIFANHKLVFHKSQTPPFMLASDTCCQYPNQPFLAKHLKGNYSLQESLVTG
jgi:hypothetical protein